jgi:hypothetical protein
MRILYYQAMVTQLKPAAPDSRPLGTRRSGCGRPSGRQLVWSLVFGVSLIIATSVLRHLSLPPAARYLIPILPILFGLLYMRAMVDDIRRQMDELQLRIYLEAAAVVVGGLFIIALIYPLLQAAHFVGPLDYFAVLMLIAVLGFIGYFVAARRYR